MCAKANNIYVMAVYCINKLRSKLGRIIKTEFEGYLLIVIYNSFLNEPGNNQIALLRLSVLVKKTYFNFYSA